MERADRKSSVMIAAQSEKIAVQIRGIMPSGFGQYKFQSSMAQVKQALSREVADILIIYAPLADELGVEGAIDIADKRPTMGILLLVKAEAYDETVYRVRDHGIMVLSRPLSTQMMVQSLMTLRAMQRRVAALMLENEKLRKKLEDERYCGRAKALLIERRQMTEQEAHKYIEREAMNNSASKREIAIRIIRESGRIVIS